MNTQFETNESKEDWLTPPYIVEALGKFDLDPCACETAYKQLTPIFFTKYHDGLNKKWFGRVWCNPPYSTKAGLFLEKLADHGNGIALIFARTETKAWFNHIWYKATALLFIKGRVKFLYPNGTQGGSAGSPSVLVAYGRENAEVLLHCGLKGKYVRLK